MPASARRKGKRARQAKAGQDGAGLPEAICLSGRGTGSGALQPGAGAGGGTRRSGAARTERATDAPPADAAAAGVPHGPVPASECISRSGKRAAERRGPGKGCGLFLVRGPDLASLPTPPGPSPPRLPSARDPRGPSRARAVSAGPAAVRQPPSANPGPRASKTALAALIGALPQRPTPGLPLPRPPRTPRRFRGRDPWRGAPPGQALTGPEEEAALRPPPLSELAAASPVSSHTSAPGSWPQPFPPSPRLNL